MLFVDSCDPLAIQEIFAMGIAEGVTTNPIILARRARELGPADMRPLLENLLNAATHPSLPLKKSPVFVQLTETTESEMVEQGLQYSEISRDRIGVKVPFSEVGLRVASRLTGKNVIVNITSVMSVGQAYLAMMTRAEYVSIFVGRITDMGGSGNAVIKNVRNLRDAYSHYPPRTKIIAGSIRQPIDVLYAAEAGAHIVTASPEILKKLLWNPQTERTNAEFAAAATTQ
jgi:transaldolase